jgi:molybdenum cofactor cytidylyltransferase
MKYGAVPVIESEGAVLAHALRPDEGSPIRKGTILTGDMIERLVRAGIENVLVARLEAGDVIEDDAASQLAASLQGNNIHAESLLPAGSISMRTQTAFSR